MILESIISGQFLKDALQKAIGNGVPSVYLAYLFLLPITTSLIASARHLLGLTTYGTFLPAIISVIWLQVGLKVGFLISVALFLWLRLLRIITKKALRKFKVNYLPRMAIFLLFLCLGLLILALIPGLSQVFIKEQTVFAFLVLILITQNLVETQVSLSKKEARTMLLETAIFALLGCFILGCPVLQKFVLSHPNLTIVLMLIFNIFAGRYVGFRLLEYRRFRSIVKQ